MLINDQAENLRRQLATKKNTHHAKTISIVSGKGGVGKSNFALNFSLELIDNGKKVLLFDLDVGMGNIDILLGLHANSTLIDMLHKNLSIHDIIEIGPNELAYISGGSGLNDFFSLDQRKKRIFYEQYSKLLSLYDYIIFDMGAGVTSDSLFFVLASDECIVITTPEPTSITDGYSMIKHIVNKNPDLPLFVVINRCTSEKEGKYIIDKFQQIVSQFLSIEIKKLGLLPDDRTVSTAVKRQTPYVLLNKRSAISKSMKQLAENYLNHDYKLKVVKPFSFINKLKHFMRER